MTCSETNTLAAKGNKWTHNFYLQLLHCKTVKIANGIPVNARTTEKIRQEVPGKLNF